MRRLVFPLLVLTLTAACGGDTPDRDATGQFTESGDASVFELAVGDCFDDPQGSGDVIFEVPVVPCSDPHDNEVYFEYEMSGTDFPGEDAALESSAQRCLTQFQPFVGSRYEESDLEIFPITPTADSWEQQDRVVYCVLYSLDLSKLTGTMRNSGR